MKNSNKNNMRWTIEQINVWIRRCITCNSNIMYIVYLTEIASRFSFSRCVVFFFCLFLSYLKFILVIFCTISVIVTSPQTYQVHTNVWYLLRFLWNITLEVKFSFEELCMCVCVWKRILHLVLFGKFHFLSNRSI